MEDPRNFKWWIVVLEDTSGVVDVLTLGGFTLKAVVEDATTLGACYDTNVQVSSAYGSFETVPGRVVLPQK